MNVLIEFAEVIDVNQIAARLLDVSKATEVHQPMAIGRDDSDIQIVVAVIVAGNRTAVGMPFRKRTVIYHQIPICRDIRRFLEQIGRHELYVIHAVEAVIHREIRIAVAVIVVHYRVLPVLGRKRNFDFHIPCTEIIRMRVGYIGGDAREVDFPVSVEADQIRTSVALDVIPRTRDRMRLA